LPVNSKSIDRPGVDQRIIVTKSNVKRMVAFLRKFKLYEAIGRIAAFCGK
jgi:hypothetical protein